MRVTLLFVLFSVMSHLSAAQTVSPQPEPAPQQAPTVKPEPEKTEKAIPISINPGEPFGIALEGGVDRYAYIRGGEAHQEPRKARIEWGMKRSSVNDMLRPPSGTSSYDNSGLSCTAAKTGVNSCFTNVSAPWTADFGDSFRWSMEPYLQFTPDEQFYSYSILFTEEAFADTKKTLLGRLGKPKSDLPSTVENRMGAKFDQEIIIWETAHTRVMLIQRNPANLTKGALSVTYIPLEKAIPPEPTAEAPF